MELDMQENGNASGGSEVAQFGTTRAGLLQHLVIMGTPPEHGTELDGPYSTEGQVQVEFLTQDS
eukprot:522020-Amphidinium_carterae.2